MTDVAQIQPEHFVPVTNRKEKRMKIERKYKNLIRKPLVWHKFSFHEWGYITLYALHSYLHSCYVRVVRGRVPLCLRRFAPWWNATEFLRASKKGWRNILSPNSPILLLILLPLQGPLTFFRSFPFHRLLFIRISSFEARSGLFGGYRRKKKEKYACTAV